MVRAMAQGRSRFERWGRLWCGGHDKVGGGKTRVCELCERTPSIGGSCLELVDWTR
jgi:hypothetical protein